MDDLKECRLHNGSCESIKLQGVKVVCCGRYNLNQIEVQSTWYDAGQDPYITSPEAFQSDGGKVNENCPAISPSSSPSSP